MVKFFKLCAIAIILSVAVSCGNNAGSPATQEVSGSHSITISYIKNDLGEDHGEVTASKTKDIAPDEKIYLTITPDDSYKLNKLDVKCDDGGNVYVTDNSFVMPNKDVSIVCSFEAQGATYTVGSSEIENGEISFYIGSKSPQNSLQASKGTTVSILVLPNRGFEVDTLTATSASGKNLTIYENTFAMPEEAVTVGATFKASASSYTVKSSETQNGKVLFSVGSRSPETSLAVAKGTTVAIKATPDSGYAFYSLTVKDASGKEIQVMQNTFAMPENDVTVTAVFKKIYTITINKPTNGNIGVETPRGRWTTNDGAQTVEAFAGETIVYDAILESGSIYKLDTFTITGVDGIDASKQKKNSFVMPQSDVTINATFKQKSNYYIGTKCNTGEKDEYGYDKYETTSPYGTLTCDKEYALEGEEVTVTVTPTTGGAGEKDYAVEKLCLVYNYSTILIPIDKAGGQVAFTVPAADTAIEVRAKFAEKTYSIKLADNITGGSITGFNSSGNHLGQKIRLFVTPDDGYKLTGISIEGESVTLDDFYCFEMPKADITIKPTFTPGATGRSITINPSEHGSVSCAKTTGVMPGSTVALMATPDSGYKLNQFIVTPNGSGTVAVSDNTFIMPDSDVSVSAEFLNGEERDVYVWITLSDTTIAERWRKNIAPGTVVTSDSLPAGYVISSVYVTKYVTEHPELWNQGEDIQLTSRTDTDYSFVMPDCNAHVHIYLKAPVKPKPDTIGDIVLEDGTAVAYENRSKLSETQKWHSIAVIFYDGKASTDLGNCVLGVGLAEGIGNWCYDTETASYVRIPEITANPIRWGESVTHAEFGKEVPVFGYPKREREVTFTGVMDGQIRGTNNLSKVRNYLGNDDFHLDKMKAFEYCENYKDQDGSRLKWIEDKQYQTGWYLPTIAELTYLLEKVGWVNGCISDVYGKTIISAFGSEDYYWSSSAVSGNKLEAWLARSESLARNESSDPDVSLLSYYKGNFNHIRAIREF